MPFAIYQLSIDGEIHHDFYTYGYDKPEVIADVAKYVQRYHQELAARANPVKEVTLLTTKMLEADLYLALDDMGHRLDNVELKVLEIIDKDEEPKIALLRKLILKADDIGMKLNQSGNKEGELRHGQLVFGARRVLGRRMSTFGAELTPGADALKREQDKVAVDYYYQQAAVFEYLLNYTYDDAEFTIMLEAYAKAQLLKKEPAHV